MRLVRLLCVVVLVGFCAVVARADATTPVDPIAHFESPDPACVAPYCTEVTYLGSTTSSTVVLFFSSVPPYPTGVPANPPAFSCDFIDDGSPMPCSAEEVGNTFFGFDLTLLPGATYGQTFSLTVDGGPITLTLPSDTCEGGSTDCTPGGNVTVDPVPEPSTALLFMSGLALLFLAGVAKRYFGARSVA
jgi:PEP-CTERM motif